MTNPRSYRGDSCPLLIIAGMAVVVVIGGAFALHTQRSDCRNFEYVPPREITAQEYNGFVQETEPMSIIVRFRDPAEIRKETTPNTLSYALPYAHPCEVVLPTGMKIYAFPRKADANFGHDEDMHLIAHEFLHCIRGDWHRSPS